VFIQYIYIYIYMYIRCIHGVYTVCLAGTSPYLRSCPVQHVAYSGLAQTIHIYTYIRCIHGIFNKLITLLTVMYSVKSSICRVGQNHTYIYGVYTVFLTGTSTYLRSCPV